MPSLHFEDFLPGSATPYGGVTVDRDAMLAYAREFDAQPMHVDEQAAKATMAGELIASGTDLSTVYNTPVINFFPFDSSSRGGVRVAVKDIDADAKLDLVAASGEGEPSRIATYLGSAFVTPNPTGPNEVFDPFGAVLPAGVFVG